jgi:hypothetical protein
MNYFKILGLVFGTIALLKPVYIHVIPYDENKFIARAYSNKRPVWIVPVVIIGLLLVLYTWYIEITTNYAYSVVISLLFTLTAVKGLILLFNYRKFYMWVSKMLRTGGGKEILRVNIGASIFGFIMIILTIILL